jgi:Cytochrome c554 and c-prime
VRTAGADGAMHDFVIRYTFGVYPLQQYLVALPGGRLQPLPLAWDARPAAEGGQRWFVLDAAQLTGPPDESHWTGRTVNWNYMCADCHSTAVRKGYDAAADSFHTTWAEIDVGCEGCHGPGARHVAWGGYPAPLRRLVWRDDRLASRFADRRGVAWSSDSLTGMVTRNVPRPATREIETCAQCHARRVHIADGYEAGRRWLDYYDPLTLLPGLYHPDGQQLDEVYTWGSFLQSRMYNAGVTCSDCHDPHSAKPRRPGNGACLQCHQAARYDTTAHTFHADSAGSRCTSCHMPTATYMGIDPRHDHSLRIPRPDQTITLGVPNACNGCHADRSAQWAAAAVRAWYPVAWTPFQRFAPAFAADDRGDPAAPDSLAAVAGDRTEPALVRASALSRLAAWPGAVPVATVAAWASDTSALVRRATLDIAESLPAPGRIAVAAPLLTDRLRAVRQQAAWVLSPVADSLVDDALRRAFDAAARELVASLRYNADRADARLSLGVFFSARQQLDSAATEFEAAIRLAPHRAQAYVNLAAVRQRQGRIADALQVVRDGLARLPDEASLRQALSALTGAPVPRAPARRP